MASQWTPPQTYQKWLKLENETNVTESMSMTQYLENYLALSTKANYAYPRMQEFHS